jgi:glycosyltransferase involved in cell wall biosynthesis
VSVLLVSNFLSSAGLNRGYSEELADRLEARGVAVVRTSSQPGRARRLADMLRTVWQRRREFQVAVVDVFSGPSFVWAEAVAFALRRLGKPFALVLRGGALPTFGGRWPRRVRRLFASAARVIAPSRYLATAMQAHRDGIDVIPNAIEVARYPTRTRDRARPRLVWIRALHAIYNPLLAVDVLARVPEAHLVMVGPDKDGSRAAVDARARELGVQDRIELPGGVAKRDVPAYLAAGDVFLNTTNIDNTPLSVLEAMAAGMCVVSTSVGGIPYLVEDGETGLLVPPGDAPAMAAAVERVVGEPALAHKLSRNARALAERCDWSLVLSEWEHLLEDLGHRG